MNGNHADISMSNILSMVKAFGYKNPGETSKYSDGKDATTRFLTQQVMKFDVNEGQFPIPTLRPTAIKSGIKEMLWIYQMGSNKLSDAHELGINWWDGFDVGDGTIGHRYGYTVQKHGLMRDLLEGMEEDPFGRRHILNLWQTDDFKSGPGLPPCAFLNMYSVYEANGKRFMDDTLIQRSSDFITAGFINASQYLALCMMIAGHLEWSHGMKYHIGTFMHLLQDCHIYERHMPAVNELLERGIGMHEYSFRLKTAKNFYDYTIDDFEFNLPTVGGLSHGLDLAIGNMMLDKE